MKDLECPYCGHYQDVCDDDVFGDPEDGVHEALCHNCEKNFIFTISISFNYKSSQADCLNGQPHNFYPSHTHPKEYTKMICKDCDIRRKPTDDEMKEIMK